MDRIPETTQPARNYSLYSISLFLGAVLLVTLIIGYSIYKLRSDNSGTIEKTEQNNDIEVNISDHTLVYGTWSGQESVILAYDMSTGKEGIIAKLPTNVKKVSVVSPDALLYIKETDLRDYGREIALYSVSQGTSQTLFTTADGFGIDDYVLSPDMQYIAIWEVQPDQATGTLSGGKSRVYTARVSTPDQKNLIYAENAAPNPVHYPRAILNDGTVFMDRFLPNDGAGWAYGMSVSNFTGTQKQDLANMQNGTYGTQPVLSPDGKYLAFAGYDAYPNLGLSDNRGFRQAVLTPNTLELLDTRTLQRENLTTKIGNGIYGNIQWDGTGENLKYTAISKDTSISGNYIYSLLSSTTQKILDSPQQVITSLSQNMVLVGESQGGDVLLGNLGNTYEYAFTKLSTQNTVSGEKTILPLSTIMTQIITIVPSDYFGNIALVNNPEDNLQLKTFEIKPSLEPRRESQQSAPSTPTGKPTESIPTPSTPLCRVLATERCNEILGTNYPSPDDIWEEHKAAQGDPSFLSCYKIQRESTGQCYDSPLYIYGPKATDLTIKVHTPIFEPSAPYSDGFKTILNGDGTFRIQNKNYASIDFDYTPALRRIIPPTRGNVVHVEKLEQSLRSYAEKLGLNKKETFDLVQYGKTSVDGPYVFVSFFDHKTSHAMLPMTFSKQPDTYRNIVFYFKNVAAPYSVTAPTFDKIERGELTVIEISGLVE